MTQAKRVVAGIDEAGLGPMLGPLAMGWSAFEVPDSRSLWTHLAPLLSQKPTEDARHLIVADSKIVYTRNPRGARRLERTVLSFLGQLEDTPQSGRELVLRTPASMRPDETLFERHPWYSKLAGSLPRSLPKQEVQRWSASLTATSAHAGVRFLSGGVALHPAGALNDSYRRTDNKAVTLWEKTSSILLHLWAEFAERGLSLTIDRQGGRLHYSELLTQTFPMVHLEPLREGREGSEYLLSATSAQGVTRNMRVLFVEKADRTSFSVALASCFAKYGREVCMDAFNSYFEELQPGLKATAGYTTDGRRWVEEASETLRRESIDTDVLIRER